MSGVRLPFALALVAASACSDAKPVREARTPAPARAPASPTPASPASSVTPADGGWFAAADSAMRVHLENTLYLAAPRADSDFRECADDEGSENPPSLVAAARARILGHDSLTSGSAAEYGATEGRTRATTFRVEVTSAARMEPAWIAGLTPDSAVPSDQAYAVTAAPHVDTFAVALEDLAPLTPRWAVCAPTRPGSVAGLGFWAFVREADGGWVRPIRWTPHGASWSRVRALAESLAAEPH